MKYIEIGFGNKWFIRTEVECVDGTEKEYKGILKPVAPRSLYIRIWLRKQVIIIDTKEGFKLSKKPKSRFKLIFGLTSD